MNFPSRALTAYDHTLRAHEQGAAARHIQGPSVARTFSDSIFWEVSLSRITLVVTGGGELLTMVTAYSSVHSLSLPPQVV